MTKHVLFKSSRIIPVIAVLLILLPSISYSEAVFMKDGKIYEGRISGGDDNRIKLFLTSGGNKEIERKDILRVLVHTRYKDRIYLTQNNGVTIEGYIVNEDNENYILRSTLDSSEEIKIPRDKVETISVKRESERLLPPSTYSSVFLTDGSIIDCRIIKEGIQAIEVQPVEGDRKILSRISIMRIRYNNSYRDRKIFNKTDGTRIEGYIMEEDSESYIYRTELYSPAEAKIYKSELRSISRR